MSFYYAPYSENKPTTWSGFTLISTDTSADYAAVWGSLTLPEGRYILAVRAIDSTGNESALMNGSAYAAGVTQEILVDHDAPKVTVTAPAANQVVYESQAVSILWTLTDTTPAASVKIEYTLDYSIASPEWHEIAASTPNDGRYDWTSPDVDGNKKHVRIRITAVDLAGPLVGDVIGHTTQALSGQFKITDTFFDLPAPVPMLVADDTDVVEPGVNGFDFHATWVLSTSTNIATQRVYILPSTVNFLDLSANHAGRRARQFRHVVDGHRRHHQGQRQPHPHLGRLQDLDPGHRHERAERHDEERRLRSPCPRRSRADEPRYLS